jgi:hypothetical protein
MRLDPDCLRDMKVNIHIQEHHNPEGFVFSRFRGYICMRADGNTLDLSKHRASCA